MVKNEKGSKKESREKRDASREDIEFPVIGIGASAGGLDAFSKFFSTMPSNTGMAFVLIQHLDPSHVSNMVNLLKRQTSMPVSQAEDSMKLEPDHVYMIPPNHIMTITDRTLRLGEQADRPGISHNIDQFFRSLAADLKEKAIGIIMSGTGSDGSLGARAIKAELGMVMVQEPETAGYDGMPRSAVNAGVADFVLPAEQMASYLQKYVTESYGKRRMRREQLQTDTGTLSSILSLVRARTKHDFSNYKQSTINRRIERRMGINQIDSAEQYLQYLRKNSGEVSALVKDFLINVTSFFRDPEAFVVLKERIKEMLSGKPEGQEVRAWVPGCSTGEEAYSLGMVIVESLEEINRFANVQVFGSDLDDDAISRARTGLYPVSVSSDISQERLSRFFERVDDQLQVRRELREKLIFAVQDVAIDPPFTRMDIISARNLLIYFENELQKRLIPMFNYALNTGGLLFLGTAETIGEFTDEFETVDRKWKIYREKSKIKEPLFSIPDRPAFHELPGTRDEDRYVPKRPGHGPQLQPERIMMAAMPAGVLIDFNDQVVFSHGATGKYLQLPEGKPDMSITGLLHPEMQSAAIAGIREARSLGKQVQKPGLRLKVNGGSIIIRITVTPVKGVEKENDGYLVMTFEDVPAQRHRKTKQDGRTAELEHELQYTKETLRSTIEELETANEELRSANEEYQSTNEELQSTNEELETSREELQSLNEELTTVNSEHQSKIDELSTVNDDMKNLLNATGIATIYLDEKLNIQRFTPAATGIFNLIASDVDRPISHITSQMDNYNFAEKANRVLDSLIPVSDMVRGQDGKWYSIRISPYRTTENSIAGVVLTFIDNTGLKKKEDEMAQAKQELEEKFTERSLQQKQTEERFRALVNATSDVLYEMSPDWKEMRQLHSRGFLADTEKSNRNWLKDYIPEDERSRVTAAIDEAVRTKGVFELEHRVFRADGTVGWTLSRAVPIRDEKGKIVEWFGAANDITERKEAEGKG